MHKKNYRTAYSLIELSIVIIIISILITGALSVSIGSINNAKIKTTNERLAEVYKGIGNFLVTYKRLPCPASLKKIKTSDSDYGVEVGGGSDCVGAGVYESNSSNNLVYGMVPVRALGLPNNMAEDSFESKIIYIVDKNFTNTLGTTPNFSSPTFATANYLSVITINEKPAGVVQVATNDAIITLISFGANKAGAFNANSAVQNARSADADELDNDATNFNDGANTADFNNTIVASSGNSDVFDDIILFKRRDNLVEDFKAMFLIPCQNAGAAFGNVNAYYGTIVYATSSCADPNADKRLTKKCEAYGNWVDIVSSCP